MGRGSVGRLGNDDTKLWTVHGQLPLCRSQEGAKDRQIHADKRARKGQQRWDWGRGDGGDKTGLGRREGEGKTGKKTGHANPQLPGLSYSGVFELIS